MTEARPFFGVRKVRIILFCRQLSPTETFSRTAEVVRPAAARPVGEHAKRGRHAARLELVLQTPDEVLAWVESLPRADRAGVSPDWLARVRVTASGDPWALSYTVIERASGMSVGGCAFQGPPDAAGVVEVAYGIDASHRGRGLATEVAGALSEFAFATGRVHVVCAHTRLDNGASARVLATCGFRWVGEVIDPEDGPVCRWEREASGTAE